VNAIDWASLNGFLQVVMVVYILLHCSSSAVLLPLHLKGFGTDTNAVGAPNAGNLIYEYLQERQKPQQSILLQGRNPKP